MLSVFVHVVLWDIAVSCAAAAHSFTGLLAARFFLGLFEGTIAPCFITVTQMVIDIISCRCCLIADGQAFAVVAQARADLPHGGMDGGERRDRHVMYDNML